MVVVHVMQAFSQRRQGKAAAAEAALMCWQGGRLRRAWRAWADFTNDRAEKRRALQHVVARCRNKTMSCSFDLWHARTEREIDLQSRLAAAQGSNMTHQNS